MSNASCSKRILPVACSERDTRSVSNLACRSSSPGSDEVRTRAPTSTAVLGWCRTRCGSSLRPRPESARERYLAPLRMTAARQLAADQRVWFIDAGRLDETNPSLALVGHASLTVLVVGARTEDLVQVPSCVERLRKRCERIGVIVSGQTPFSKSELLEFSSADRVWIVGDRNDLAAGAALALAGRRGRRTWAWRQALDVASSAAEMVPSGGSSLLNERSVEVGP